MTPAALKGMFCGLVKVELVSKTGACEISGVNQKALNCSNAITSKFCHGQVKIRG